MAITDVFTGKRTIADREAVARSIIALWMTLANGFREDERSVEGTAFAARTAAIDADLPTTGEDALPDLAQQRRLLEMLVPLVAERIQELHERIDDLDATIRTRDRDLQVVQLAGSWMTDEMARCRKMLTQALQGREAVLPTGGPDGTGPLLTELLAQVLNIAAPPPQPVASQGRRTETLRRGDAAPTAPAAQPVGDRAIIVQALREVLNGTAEAPRLARALEEQELARRLADLFHEHRSYRAILRRLGILQD